MQRKEALKQLNLEFRRNMELSRQKGLVDLKTLCRTGEDTSTHEYVWTLNNALKVCDDPDVQTFSTSEVDAALDQFDIR